MVDEHLLFFIYSERFSLNIRPGDDWKNKWDPCIETDSQVPVCVQLSLDFGRICYFTDSQVYPFSQTNLLLDLEEEMGHVFPIIHPHLRLLQMAVDQKSLTTRTIIITQLSTHSHNNNHGVLAPPASSGKRHQARNIS